LLFRRKRATLRERLTSSSYVKVARTDMRAGA